MSFLTLLFVLAATPFQPSIDRAFAEIQNKQWVAAAVALDQAYAEEPAIFAANNFHYLRGRVAENQNDWRRAREEYRKIADNNPIYPLATWRAARASTQLRDDAATLELFALLPRTFPLELKLQVARESGESAGLKLYQDLSGREARFERARLQNDTTTMWSLIRETKDDDYALRSAQLVVQSAKTPGDLMQVAEVFAIHRQFDASLPLYRQASVDTVYTADARFRIARIYFQQEKYQLAIDAYRNIATDFAGTDWEKDAEYQIASCYWRLADYRNSEKTYNQYIQKYGSKGMKEAATRNLVDVYRALGENQKALTILDRALVTRLSAATRQVMLFTKAKILYTEKRYAQALAIFQQLGRTKLRSAPGAATAEEVQYFQALSQSKLGRKTAANAIWQKLARDPFSYYGQRSAEKLGRSATVPNSAAAACVAGENTVLKTIESGLTSLMHPLRNEIDPAADAVSELMFLRLWDEAAFWLNRSETRLARRAAAQVAYMGGVYNRSISLADRLPKTASTLPLVYPAGYRDLICGAAATHSVDPLWLHAIIWQESKYDPEVRSGASARGLMQFIPETAQAVATSIGMPLVSVERLYEPAVSIQLGAAYWSSLMRNLKTPEMALAAYNGGPDNVQRWIAKSQDPELFVSDIGFVETKKYVMLVFAARAAYSSLVN